MLTAISRYGARIPPGARAIVAECRRTGTLVKGPHLAAFEQAFARRVGARHAVATSYGRMAFYQILKALQLPAGSEVILPALTFWVIPEIVRVAGLRPVFVDVDPRTFTLDPEAVEAAIGPRTCAIVPTHLYGLPCDMDPLLDLANRHALVVIEDCAHALGATYRRRPAGSFGHAAFFSFQLLKPLNTFGGGMAVTNDPGLARRIEGQASAHYWPAKPRVERRLRLGRVQSWFLRPGVFSLTGFPILWASSWVGANPDVYLWEPIRRLTPLPAPYLERFSNVQAALGLAGLDQLDAWTRRARANVRRVDEALGRLPTVEIPYVPSDREHVYYQYCVCVPDRDAVVRRAIRWGIDLETLHVDLCPRLALFGASTAPFPHAERASRAVQIPVYAALSNAEVQRIGWRVRRVLAGRAALPAVEPRVHTR